MDKKGSTERLVVEPRPGSAIISFCGGRIEIILRILAPLFGSVPALAAAAVALVTMTNDHGYTNDKTTDNVYAVTGVVITVAGFGIITELIMIVIRFWNPPKINQKINVFFVTDILISFALAGGHSVGGSAVLQEYFGDDEWLYSYASYTGTMKRSMIVTAVFSFGATFLFIHLGILMMFNMINDWNSYVTKAAIKEAGYTQTS